MATTVAMADFDTQCLKGVPEACTAAAALEGSNLGLDAFSEPDLERTMLLLQSGCEGGHQPACELITKTVELLASDCGKEFGSWSCQALGFALRHGIGMKRDDAGAELRFSEACNGNPRLCKKSGATTR